MTVAVIPFRPINPKTRLSNVLSEEERNCFAHAMLSDVISALKSVGCDVILLSTRAYEMEGAKTVVMNLGLNEALNAFFKAQTEPVLLMMADIALLNFDAVNRMLSVSADVGIAPGRGGGTNSIFIKHPQEFMADFYGASFLDHVAVCKKFSQSLEIVDSYRLSTDIDEEEDLTEVLIHGNRTEYLHNPDSITAISDLINTDTDKNEYLENYSECKKYLISLGFSLSIEKGRVGVHRGAHKEAL